MKEKINEIRNKVETTYAMLNNFDSKGVLPFLDAVYPNHDGTQDAEFSAELLLLRDSLQDLLYACQDAIEKINETVEP